MENKNDNKENKIMEVTEDTVPVTSAKKRDIGHLDVPNVENKKKRRKQSNPSNKSMALKDPTTSTTSASTAVSWDTECLNAQPTLKPHTDSKTCLEGSLTTTPKSPEETNALVAIGTGLEKPSKCVEEAKKKKKKSAKSLKLTITPTSTSKEEEPSLKLEKEELQSLARALIKGVGPRRMTDIVAAPQWTVDEWMPVVVNFCTIEDYHPGDSMQMLLGSVYWIPKVLRHSPWMKYHLMKTEYPNLQTVLV